MLIVIQSAFIFTFHIQSGFHGMLNEIRLCAPFLVYQKMSVIPPRRARISYLLKTVLAIILFPLLNSLMSSWLRRSPLLNLRRNAFKFRNRIERE